MTNVKAATVTMRPAIVHSNVAPKINVPKKTAQGNVETDNVLSRRHISLG